MTTIVRTGVLLAVIVPLLAAGCGGGAEIAPPDIRFGEDVCVECNMIISDARFASAYVHEAGPDQTEALAFDDIGDMLDHADKNPDHTIAAWYVHDYDNQEWIDATTAQFVYSAELRTPMSQGTAAHATAASAEAMLAGFGGSGELLDWSGLKQLHETDGLGPFGSMGGHSDG